MAFFSISLFLKLKHKGYLFYLFLFHTFIISLIQYIHDFIHLLSPRPLSISSLLVAQREKSPWSAEPIFEDGPAIHRGISRRVPGHLVRESNPGLPSSRPTHYFLSYAAPYYRSQHWLRSRFGFLLSAAHHSFITAFLFLPSCFVSFLPDYPPPPPTPSPQGSHVNPLPGGPFCPPLSGSPRSDWT